MRRHDVCHIIRLLLKMDVSHSIARSFFVQYTKSGENTKRTKNIPNDHKIYQMAVQQTKGPLNVSKFTQNCDFGWKINRLATLVSQQLLLLPIQVLLTSFWL
jgi:hypothetical protein